MAWRRPIKFEVSEMAHVSPRSSEQRASCAKKKNRSSELRHCAGGSKIRQASGSKEWRGERGANSTPQEVSPRLCRRCGAVLRASVPAMQDFVFVCARAPIHRLASRTWKRHLREGSGMNVKPSPMTRSPAPHPSAQCIDLGQAVTILHVSST